MKVVILAGGFGTRLSEETAVRPKPMVEIGGQPILWHIMKYYSAFGLNEFVICCGYKGYVIKEYFANYVLHRSDVTFDLKTNTTEYHETSSDAWRVTLIDTGQDSMTGGRLRRVADHVRDNTFCMTYGDGLANVPIDQLIAFHRKHGQLATLTAVQPPGRFGAIALGAEEDKVTSFNEKPTGDGAWINGGFFVLEPGVLEYIDSDDTIFEREPLERLARDGQLNAFKHTGMFEAMDTLRDRHVLESMWASPNPPWKVWS